MPQLQSVHEGCPTSKPDPVASHVQGSGARHAGSSQIGSSHW